MEQTYLNSLHGRCEQHAITLSNVYKNIVLSMFVSFQGNSPMERTIVSFLDLFKRKERPFRFGLVETRKKEEKENVQAVFLAFIIMYHLAEVSVCVYKNPFLISAHVLLRNDVIITDFFHPPFSIRDRRTHSRNSFFQRHGKPASKLCQSCCLPALFLLITDKFLIPVYTCYCFVIYPEGGGDHFYYY